MSSIFEQKRHYENEIETLKRDLDIIEKEELKIKSRLWVKSGQGAEENSRSYRFESPGP